jgi:DnaJ-class molecular chaperone
VKWEWMCTGPIRRPRKENTSATLFGGGIRSPTTSTRSRNIAGKCQHWHSNDGDGLDFAAALELATILQAEIDSGRCERRARIYTSAQEAEPDVVCDLCDGTGTRKPVPEWGAGDLASGIRCNACAGEGHVRPWPTHYPFDVENVRQFIAFLRGCGGFAIC